MKSFFASALGLLAAASLSAAVVTGGGTGTPTTPTTPVVPPKPTTGGCQKPAAKLATKLATKPAEKKCDEKKAAPKPAPIKSAAPVCKKK
ncbi:MAG: hypothetical protein B9S29_03910 [Opitutia bacterium Tous-C2FEB]|nr:MAG: hypothetical protein B9S29_03910 [Opitutae bacterium Tous-C2FEB]PAZ03125.1 MAG: hypothetical protein CAK89_03235 [Opitutae bacterium AMD-G3]